MAKKKPEVRIKNWGIYTPWDHSAKSLPTLLKSTFDIPCEEGIEFGYIANIKKAKNKKLQYCIYHPDIPDETGNSLPPFSGEEYIRQNDWNFFIGDTIWKPIGNKQGPWRITLAIDGEIITDKTFRLLPTESAN
ncbi:DUF3859 domain-containing protein [Gilvimarinus sp. 1_MG-2023]|uniref:DUF3859 domain-containing protein n=1 Tax=Gilvimarinus sp. 1_MG-2023 TaxID=3062638 RepID=UPI0026E17BCE|nr:DUF3859 domain-containing protein [Gilvimarinus sp. 1_MG-2023]MDO6747033.1 DUF3859 domain-containing protein [Gilvimarinus sp. 1_MG-2023]